MKQYNAAAYAANPAEFRRDFAGKGVLLMTGETDLVENLTDDEISSYFIDAVNLGNGEWVFADRAAVLDFDHPFYDY